MNKIDALKYLVEELATLDKDSRKYQVLEQVIKSDINDFEEIELDWMVETCQKEWIVLRDYYVDNERIN